MASQVPDVIRTFLKQNRVATICYVDDKGLPVCINCFYAFDDKFNLLVFKSSEGNKHEKASMNLSVFSGSVLPEHFDAFRPRGLQFSGKSMTTVRVKALELQKVYYKRYAFARILPGYIWAIELNRLKLVDQTVGIISKSTWKKEDPSQSRSGLLLSAL
jgi:uncharacterized protein